MRILLPIWIALLPAIASAQVTIAVPQKQYQPHELIDVTITNTGSRKVTFCTEFGQWSYPANDHLEITPTPVHVQRQSQRKWSTLLNGPDIGSSRHPDNLAPGESRHYPFRLVDKGKLRLVLECWLGSDAPACNNPRGRKLTRSQVFVIE